jgi:hypothetical protein
MGSDTEGAGGSTPPAPTTTAVSSAFADNLVPTMERDQERAVVNGWESVYLFNRGVLFRLSRPRPPNASADVDQGAEAPRGREAWTQHEGC